MTTTNSIHLSKTNLKNIFAILFLKIALLVVAVVLSILHVHMYSDHKQLQVVKECV